jgi:hypothetical protein
VGVFSSFVIYNVGDESKIRFWHDLWCGDQPLKTSFPNLFSIACCKDVWVVDHMQNSLQWNIFFTRKVYYSEVDLVSSFFHLLYSIRLRKGGEDKICWIPCKRRKFEVRSFYHVLSIPTVSSFLGRVFGELRLLREWRSLCGRLH